MSENPVKSELLGSLENEVHVWSCFPDSIRHEETLSAYRSVLSAEELQHYFRFNHDEDRHNYLVSHALLRNVLSKYVDIEASCWQFSSGEHGKPELVRSACIPDLTFNLTHTRGLSACVISLERSVGIDAEHTRRKNKLDGIARRMFSEQELAAMSVSSDSQQYFYCLWTLGEAYVKALGTGLSGSSKRFYFDLDLQSLDAVFKASDAEVELEAYGFKLYLPTAEHVLAVAFESPQSVNIRQFEFIS